MSTGLYALGLELIVEGLAWMLGPALSEQMLELLRRMPIGARRQIGALALVSGLILLWIAGALGGF